MIYKRMLIFLLCTQIVYGAQESSLIPASTLSSVEESQKFCSEHGDDLGVYLGLAEDPLGSVVSAFLVRGGDVNHRYMPACIKNTFLLEEQRLGMTLSMIALHRGCIDAFKVLIAHSEFDPFVKDECGQTLEDHMKLIDKMSEGYAYRPSYYRAYYQVDPAQDAPVVSTFQTAKKNLPEMRALLEAVQKKDNEQKSQFTADQEQ